MQYDGDNVNAFSNAAAAVYHYCVVESENETNSQRERRDFKERKIQWIKGLHMLRTSNTNVLFIHKCI